MIQAWLNFSVESTVELNGFISDVDEFNDYIDPEMTFGSGAFW